MDTIIAHKQMTIWQVKLAVQARDGISPDAFELYCLFPVPEELTFELRSALGTTRRFLRPDVSLEALGLSHQKITQHLYIDVNARDQHDPSLLEASHTVEPDGQETEGGTGEARGERRSTVLLPWEPSIAQRSRGAFMYEMVPPNELFSLSVIYGAAVGTADDGATLSDQYAALRDRIAQSRSTVLDGYRLLAATGAALPEDVRHAVLLAAEPKLTSVTKDPQELAEFVCLNSLDVSANELPFHPLGAFPALLTLHIACNNLRDLQLVTVPENREYEVPDTEAELDEAGLGESGESTASDSGAESTAQAIPSSSTSPATTTTSVTLAKPRPSEFCRFGFLPKKRSARSDWRLRDAPIAAFSATIDAIPSIGLWQSLLLAFGESVAPIEGPGFASSARFASFGFKLDASTSNLIPAPIISRRIPALEGQAKSPIDQRLDLVADILRSSSTNAVLKPLTDRGLRDRFGAKPTAGPSTRIGGRVGDIDVDIDADLDADQADLLAGGEVAPYNPLQAVDPEEKLNDSNEPDTISPDEVTDLLACQEVLFYPLQLLLSMRYMHIHRHHISVCTGLSNQTRLKLNRQAAITRQEEEASRGLELLQGRQHQPSANKPDSSQGKRPDSTGQSADSPILPPGTVSILTNPDDSTLLDVIALRHTDLYLRVPPYPLSETCGFGALTTLDLSYNSLSLSSILQLTLLPFLQDLNLTSNGLICLPPDLSGFWSLRKLNLRRNTLGTLLPSSLISQNDGLTLQLRDAELSGEILLFLSLSTIPLLEEVDLSENNITNIPSPAALARLSQRMTEMMTPPEATDIEGGSGSSTKPVCGLIPFAHAAPLQIISSQDLPGGSKEQSEADSALAVSSGHEERQTRWKRTIGFAHLSAKKPFPWLRALGLAHNLIKDEASVVALASFKRLAWADLRGNPLTESLEAKETLPPLHRAFPLLTNVFVEAELLARQQRADAGRSSLAQRDVRLVMAQPRGNRFVTTQSAFMQASGSATNEPHILRPLNYTNQTLQQLTSALPSPSPHFQIAAEGDGVPQFSLAPSQTVEQNDPHKGMLMRHPAASQAEEVMTIASSTERTSLIPDEPYERLPRSTMSLRRSEFALKTILSRPIGQSGGFGLTSDEASQKSRKPAYTPSSTLASYLRQRATVQDRGKLRKAQAVEQERLLGGGSLQRTGAQLSVAGSHSKVPVRIRKQLDEAVRQVEAAYAPRTGHASASRGVNPRDLRDKEIVRMAERASLLTQTISLQPTVSRNASPTRGSVAFGPSSSSAMGHSRRVAKESSPKYLETVAKFREQRKAEQMAKDVELLLYTVSSAVASGLWGKSEDSKAGPK